MLGSDPRRLRNFGWFVLLAVHSILLNGCATKALWEEGRFARFYEPSSPPNLHLFRSAEEHTALVQYDESREDKESIRQRAYWLSLDHEQGNDPGKPRFVSVAKARGLTPIPIVDSPAAASLYTAGFCAVASTNSQTFAIYSSGKYFGAYELPMYPDASGRVKQVLLTPVAVVADLTVVGGFMLLQAWSTGGLGSVP